MLRIAGLHSCKAQTDAKDAFIIADAARAVAHTPRHMGFAGSADVLRVAAYWILSPSGKVGRGFLPTRRTCRSTWIQSP
ncbi:hypothetical protein ACIGO6_40180 [Streptomyces sp. NPDC053750]|uniref:hypothetical protein n=1 Tax=Streptomyces sp. NPDC053750 TaxID=3365714 RepID=UPI0037D2E417